MKEEKVMTNFPTVHCRHPRLRKGKEKVVGSGRGDLGKRSRRVRQRLDQPGSHIRKKRDPTDSDINEAVFSRWYLSRNRLRPYHGGSKVTYSFKSIHITLAFHYECFYLATTKNQVLKFVLVVRGAESSQTYH